MWSWDWSWNRLNSEVQPGGRNGCAVAPKCSCAQDCLDDHEQNPGDYTGMGFTGAGFLGIWWNSFLFGHTTGSQRGQLDRCMQGCAEQNADEDACYDAYWPALEQAHTGKQADLAQAKTAFLAAAAICASTLATDVQACDGDEACILAARAAHRACLRAAEGVHLSNGVISNAEVTAARSELITCLSERPETQIECLNGTDDDWEVEIEPCETTRDECLEDAGNDLSDCTDLCNDPDPETGQNKCTATFFADTAQAGVDYDNDLQEAGQARQICKENAGDRAEAGRVECVTRRQACVDAGTPSAECNAEYAACIATANQQAASDDAQCEDNYTQAQEGAANKYRGKLREIFDDLYTCFIGLANCLLPCQLTRNLDRAACNQDYSVCVRPTMADYNQAQAKCVCDSEQCPETACQRGTADSALPGFITCNQDFFNEKKDWEDQEARDDSQATIDRIECLKAADYTFDDPSTAPFDRVNEQDPEQIAECNKNKDIQDKLLAFQRYQNATHPNYTGSTCYMAQYDAAGKEITNCCSTGTYHVCLRDAFERFWSDLATCSYDHQHQYDTCERELEYETERLEDGQTLTYDVEACRKTAADTRADCRKLTFEKWFDDATPCLVDEFDRQKAYAAGLVGLFLACQKAYVTAFFNCKKEEAGDQDACVLAARQAARRCILGHCHDFTQEDDWTICQLDCLDSFENDPANFNLSQCREDCLRDHRHNNASSDCYDIALNFYTTIISLEPTFLVLTAESDFKGLFPNFSRLAREGMSLKQSVFERFWGCWSGHLSARDYDPGR